MTKAKKILITLGAFIALLVIVNTLFIAIASKRLNDQIEKIKAAGDPISLADLASKKTVPPNQNAAVLLQRIQNEVKALDTAFTNIDRQKELANGKFTDDQLQIIGAAFDAHPEVIPTIIQAAKAPHYQPDMDTTINAIAFRNASLKRIKYSRAITRLVATRVHWLRKQGNSEEAFRTCLLLFQLCRHFDREPMILGFLVATSCRTLAINTTNILLQDGSLPASAHRALEAELAAQNITGAYQYALETERVLGLALYHEHPMMSMAAWPIRSSVLNDAGDYLDGVEQLLELSSKPYSEVVAADLRGRRSKMKAMAKIALASLETGRIATDRIRAKLRCLRILNAIKAHGKTFATNKVELSELTLPTDATTDPFTGHPLQVKKTAHGWMVYSFGPNLKNDGGDLIGENDTGLQSSQQTKNKASIPQAS